MTAPNPEPTPVHKSTTATTTITTLAVLIVLSASLIKEAYLVIFNFFISLFNVVFLPERFFFAFSIPANASEICLFVFVKSVYASDTFFNSDFLELILFINCCFLVSALFFSLVYLILFV